MQQLPVRTSLIASRCAELHLSPRSPTGKGVIVHAYPGPANAPFGSIPGISSAYPSWDGPVQRPGTVAGLQQAMSDMLVQVSHLCLSSCVPVADTVNSSCSQCAFSHRVVTSPLPNHCKPHDFFWIRVVLRLGNWIRAVS